MALESPDLASMLNLIVLSAAKMLRANVAVVALWDADRAALTVRASYGADGPTLASIHPHLDRVILDNVGLVGATTPYVQAPAGGETTSGGAPAIAPERVQHILAAPFRDQLAERERAAATDERQVGSAGLLGVLYVVRDPSEREFEARDLELLDLFAQQAGTAVQQARLAAATQAERNRLETMQSSFVSIVSHELQTPVAVIKAYAGTLARPDAPWSRETVTRVAHTIEEECDRLHRLITDLLDLSRIQAGRVAMSISPVDLADLCEAVAEHNRTRAPQHTITTDFPADFPLVPGDREKLRQALGNLVDNAIKYSPDGGRVALRVEPANGNVRFVISDEGLGIPASEHRRIFEKFYRLDPDMTRGIGGTGLGLYICRELVRRVNGRIWVESHEGRGSAFHVEIPSAAAPQSDRGREAVPA